MEHISGLNLASLVITTTTVTNCTGGLVFSGHYYCGCGNNAWTETVEHCYGPNFWKSSVRSEPEMFLQTLG